MPDIQKLTARKVAEGPLPTGEAVAEQQFMKVPVKKIRASPFQPRKHFSEEKLRELRDSIRERGLLEPIILEPAPDDPGFYWIIAGERRWRAFVELMQEDPEKFSAVPAIIRSPSPPGESRANALVENLQRSDLTPLEEGDGYRNMASEDGLAPAAIAKQLGVGVDRVERCMRIAAGPELLREAMTVGASVPKLDADGKPMVKRNPDGSPKMQRVQTPQGEKEIEEPVLVLRVIRELTIAEELAKLHAHLVKVAPRNQPKKAESEFRKHLEHVLKHDMEKRRVVEYVKRIRAGERGEQRQAKGGAGESREDGVAQGKSVGLSMGVPFVSSASQLVVQKDALGTLNAEQRAALRAELNALLAQLPEESALA